MILIPKGFIILVVTLLVLATVGLIGIVWYSHKYKNQSPSQ